MSSARGEDDPERAECVDTIDARSGSMSRRDLAVAAVAVTAGVIASPRAPAFRPGGGLPDPMIGVAPTGLGTGTNSDLARFLRTTRIAVNAVLTFDQYYQLTLPVAALTDVTRANRVRILTVEPFTSRDRRASDISGILGGRYDWILRRWAVGWGGIGAVRFAHEMNGAWYPWGRSIGADAYLALWRHARSVWRSAERDHGLPHAAWIWCANVRTALFGAFYPGDDECDLVALDGYAHRANGHMGFAALFQQDVQRLERLSSHRLLVGETAVAVGAPDRARWIAEMFDYLRATPRIQGLTWYERAFESGLDYRLENDPRSSQVFRRCTDAWLASGAPSVSTR